ncbi:MAG: DUF4430 domain-containing protein [Clostridia bacterium]|nr:DUF4430 domain-containing protein [Clostridia bacterium]
MKKNFCRMLSLVLLLACCFSFAACQKNEETDLWASAIYTEDTELGSGSKTVQVEVQAEDKTVTFTLHTDKELLGEALTEHNLVSGEQGAYGLYIKTVNGILADYNKTNSYWGFTKNGESMMTGVDSVTIADGEHYELIYTQQ